MMPQRDLYNHWQGSTGSSITNCIQKEKKTKKKLYDYNTIWA